MAVQCLFFTPGGRQPCQVLGLVNASPKTKLTQAHLESRYCLSGRFIACPLFCRVEQGLVEANRIRGRLARKTSAGASPKSASLAAQARAC